MRKPSQREIDIARASGYNPDVKGSCSIMEAATIWTSEWRPRICDHNVGIRPLQEVIAELVNEKMKASGHKA